MHDDHLPEPYQFCPWCGFGDHCWCKDTDLDLADVGPLIALHDAALRVEGEAVT